MFMVCAAVMAAAVVAMLAPALRGRLNRGRDRDRDDLAAQNIRAARQRLRELDEADEGDAGDAAARAEFRDEIERQLLDDLDAGGDGARPPKTPGKWSAALILGAIPAAAAALYWALGAPDALMPRAPAATVSATATAPPSLDEVRRRLEQALELQPANKNALRLAALAAEAAGDHRRAAEYLHRLLPLVADQPAARAEVRALLDNIGRIEAAGNAAR